MFEKILLGLCVICSWGAAFLTSGLFTADPFGYSFLVFLFLVFLLLLTPFALFLYLFPEDYTILGAFAAGMAGFLFLAPSWTALIGVAVVAGGFFYWRYSISWALKTNLAPSATFILQGMGLFLSSLALFASLLFLASPAGKANESFTPSIPRGFFDTIYEPTSRFVLTRFVEQQGASASRQQEALLKETLYKTLNTGLQQTAASYQSYVPFVFAAGVFFFLKSLFVFFKYGVEAIVFALVYLFLKLGILKKEMIDAKKEVIRPAG